MAEKTNKGMNFLFTPTLIEFEKTISLPMLSRKFQTHPVPVLSFLPDYPNQSLDYQPASTYPNNKEKECRLSLGYGLGSTHYWYWDLKTNMFMHSRDWDFEPYTASQVVKWYGEGKWKIEQ